jgi:hypothetical protein
MYEEGVQCQFDERKSDSDDDLIESQRENKKGFRRSVFISGANVQGKKVPTTNRKEANNLFEEKTSKIGNEGKNEETSNLKQHKQITEEMRRQILNSQELSEFLTQKSKYVERVINIFI